MVKQSVFLKGGTMPKNVDSKLAFSVLMSAIISYFLSVLFCTIFGFFTGPIYMVLDPIRFLLGKQCISQNQ